MSTVLTIVDDAVHGWHFIAGHGVNTIDDQRSKIHVISIAFLTRRNAILRLPTAGIFIK